MSIIEFIEYSLKEAERINVMVNSLQEIPTYPQRTTGVFVMPMVSKHYDKEQENAVSAEMKVWQDTIRNYLRDSFGSEDEKLRMFERTILPTHSRGMDYKEEYETELREGASVLKSIKNAIELSGKSNGSKSIKAKKIFISHAGLNKNAADKIVDFLKLIGVPNESIFCSSTLGNDFEVTENFVKGLHTLFNEYDLFTIILHSKEFYERPICLNEMGAAWATNTPIFSIVLHDCDQKILKGVVRPDNIAIIIDQRDHAVAHLNDLHEQLENFLQKTLPVKITEWDGLRFRLVDELINMQPSDNGTVTNATTLQNNKTGFNMARYQKPVPLPPNMNPHTR